jgi:hypothetical protein
MRNTKAVPLLPRLLLVGSTEMVFKHNTYNKLYKYIYRYKHTLTSLACCLMKVSVTCAVRFFNSLGGALLPLLLLIMDTHHVTVGKRRYTAVSGGPTVTGRYVRLVHHT